MFSSEAVTRSLRVQVESYFDPQRSRPTDEAWFFLYTITITNEGQETVQLLSRYWKIVDEKGEIEEVRGPGVVGEQPVLEPGESFQYTSGCPLKTATGTMEGTYRMVGADGKEFDIEVSRFFLSEPYMVN